MAKSNQETVYCRECFWANLIQYGNNPVLAECRQKPDYMNSRFPYEREVASAPRNCKPYKYQDPAEKTVQQRVANNVIVCRNEKGAEAAA